MTESLHTFIARLIFTIEALQQSRSIGFALASFRNTHPSLQATVIDGVQQSTDAGMCPSEVKAYNAHQSFIRFHNGQNDFQLHTGIELPALTDPCLSAVLLSYRAQTAGSATLDDTADVLDFINA